MDDHAVTRFALRHEVTPLSGGLTNSGIAWHSLSRNDRAVIDFVEKHTRKPSEGIFYTEKYKILEKSAVNVPKLYKVNKISSYNWEILSEYINRKISIPELNTDEAFILGSYFAEIVSLELPELKVNQRNRSLTIHDIESMEEFFQSDDEVRAGRIIKKNLAIIEGKLSKLPDVTSHGDLKWGNMAVPDVDFSTSPYIFDWETASLICLGADLHFFAAQYLVPETWDVGQKIFEGFTFQANKKLSLERDFVTNDLILAALSFGLKTRMGWVQNMNREKYSPTMRLMEVQLASHLGMLAETGELS